MLGLQNAHLHPMRPSESTLLLVPQPQLPLNDPGRFLFNQSHLLNMNGLVKLTNGLTLRVNNHLFYDSRKLNSITKSNIISPVDSFSFFESLTNRSMSELLRTTITLNSNTRKNYLENKLQFEALGHDVDANIRFQDASSLQLLKQPRLCLNNSFRTVFPVIGHLIELKSFVQFEKLDETLNLEPGMVENIFNNGNPYDAVNQTVLTKRIYTHQSAGFITKWRRLTFFPSAGFVFRMQSLNARLTTSTDAVTPPDTGCF